MLLCNVMGISTLFAESEMIMIVSFSQDPCQTLMFKTLYIQRDKALQEGKFNHPLPHQTNAYW